MPALAFCYWILLGHCANIWGLVDSYLGCARVEMNTLKKKKNPIHIKITNIFEAIVQQGLTGGLYPFWAAGLATY